MKQSVIFIILSLLLFGSLSFSQTDNEEFRATWVITWEHISASSSVETNKARVRQILDNHQAANMNAVIWQVRQAGTAYYNSSFEPWGSYAGGSDPGYDPLAYAIEEAHKRGMEVHAWFNCFAASSTAEGSPATLHPEWVCRDQSGIAMTDSRALSPGMKAVRDYTIDVAMEIVNNYDIDGLHLDYVRWNEYLNSKKSKSYAASIDETRMMDGMITEEQIEDLVKNKSGRYLYDVDHPYSVNQPNDIPGQTFSSWEDYWRWSVTEFVQTLHDSIQSVKPWVRLSAAALGKYRWSSWQGYGSVYQDAALWFNEGYVDQLTPMHYHWTTGTEFRNMLNSGSTESWVYWIAPGIEAGRLFSVGPGSYILLENKIWYRHKDIINTCRQIEWIDGFQFFSYGSWNGAKYWEEAGNTVFNTLTKIRNNVNSPIPAEPTITITKLNDLKYEINILPDVSISDDSWYLVYRSEDATISPNEDEIIDIHFGQGSFTVIDSFPGTQDYNGQYHYSATALDRYWQESDYSNAVITDQIPSYDPELLYCSINPGDTVAINSVIQFEFSKTMNQASFQTAFTIQPESPIKEYKWSNNWTNSSKIVDVIFDGNLQVSTEYSIAISSDLTDIIGLHITPFTSNFVTKDEDLNGPVVRMNYPEYLQSNFDLDDAFTIEFDEFIDPLSINESTVLFTNGGNPTSVSIMLDSYDNRSILNIKPFPQLLPDTLNILTLTTGITDTLGNAIESNVNVEFYTDIYHYYSNKSVDDYSTDNNWWNPSGSGSTTGIISTGSEFSYSTARYLPTTEVFSSKGRSGYLKYQWDSAASNFLLREHVGDGTTNSISIDTSWIMQVYIYGDASNNQFRFSLYEKDASGNNTSSIAEVSKWRTIDWIGWRLVEWDLGDPNSVGTWLSADEQMDGHHYIMEGLHLTKPENGAWSGILYFDNLRLVKRTNDPIPPNTAPVLAALPDTFTYQSESIKIYPKWEDPDLNSIHHTYMYSDTSAITFKLSTHTSGSKVYLIPNDVFVGDATITVIVKDFSVGELSDTSSFILTVLSNSDITKYSIPTKFALEQNYPNPFNPTTTFRFSLEKSGYTQLYIYDILGRNVSKVVDQSLNAGYHNYTFNASELPSGQYIYRLSCNGNVLTKKMVLLK